ncbi:MAG: hypothetical protein K0U68_03295 [Gammaproteobacteria bacterium]|nr:hypothetical protein [Gammaproteobacteria bacterium]
MSKKLWIVLFTVMFSFANVNMVMAADAGNSSLEKNHELIDQGISLAQEALEFAKQGDAAGAYKSSYASLHAMSEINSRTWDPKLQRPRGKLRKAQYMTKRMSEGKSKKGDSLEEAAGLMEKSIAALIKVKSIEQGAR